MKKKRFKIGHLPKYDNGGFLDPENPFGQATQSVLGQLGPMLGDKPQTDESVAFADKFRGGEDTSKKITSGAASMASAIPGWGQAVGAAIQFGQGVDDAMKDEFGIYKSGAAQVAGRFLNPLGTVSGVLTGAPTQSELKHQKKVFDFNNINSQTAQNDRAGAQLKNSLPVYQAPAYGREGLKLRVGKRYSSKFSNFK